MKVLEAIKKLNAVEKEDGSSLLAEKNKVNLEKIAEAEQDDAYMTAVESIPSADEDFLPEELAKFYNSLVDALEASNKEEVKEEPTPSKPAKAEPKAKAAKVETKAKAEPKAKEKVIEKVKAEPKAKAAKVEAEPKAKEKVKAKAKKKDGEPSNKFKVYQIWKKNKKETMENLSKIAPDIKINTIKSWTSSWAKGKYFPAGI